MRIFLLLLISIIWFLPPSILEAKKLSLTLRYNDGKFWVPENKCASEIGKTRSMLRIANGFSKEISPSQSANGRAYEVQLTDKDGKVLERNNIAISQVILGSIVDLEGLPEGYKGDLPREDDSRVMEENTIVVTLPYNEAGTRVSVVSDWYSTASDPSPLELDIGEFVDETTPNGDNSFLSGCDLDIVILGDQYPSNIFGLMQFMGEANYLATIFEMQDPFQTYDAKINWYWPDQESEMY